MSSLVFKNGKDKLLDNIPKDIWAIEVIDIDGNKKILKDYTKGKKAFVFVNVASACGLTTNSYNQLASIYNRYSQKGLEVFGFPCNQFMGQESKCETEIKKYVIEEFGVEFPMFSKIEVNGDNTNDVFKYLKYHSKDLNEENKYLKNIPWNFAKFLVDSNGKVVGYYDPKTEPREFLKDIEKLL